MNLNLVPFWRSTPQVNRSSPFVNLHQEVNRLFDDFFRNRFPLTTVDSEFLVPNIDVTENENNYQIVVELPGVEAKDIEVSIVSNDLVIKAIKKIEKREDKKNYHLKECSQGAFSRNVPLPLDADPKAINAKISNGILRIHIAKNLEKSQQIRKIDVVSED